jgi:DNA repair protein SbcC/Rad50
MIKSLAINNFQSHEKTYLKFDPGVNVIVGASDSGKTAIIRALRWVVWNRPSGDDIRSHWGGDTFVIIETENGFVWRHKGKIDKYDLKVYDKSDLVFKAFGTSVPQEISQFLDINEINLQMQLDSPFLLSESPGAVASHWNKVAKLDKIDTGLQNINSEIRELTAAIKFKEKDKEYLITNLEKFEYLEKAEIELEVLEEMDKRHTTKLQQEAKLGSLLNYMHEIEKEIKEESAVLIYEKQVNDLIALRNKKYDLYLEREKIEYLVEEIQDIREQVLQNSLICTFENPVNNLISLFKAKETSIQVRKSLYKLILSITGIYQRLLSTKALKEDLEDTFEREFPEICPLCGSEVHNEN